MVDIYIGNVRVIRIGSRYSTYTEKVRHDKSADMPARKWGIGLEKAKNTL